MILAKEEKYVVVSVWSLAIDETSEVWAGVIKWKSGEQKGQAFFTHIDDDFQSCAVADGPVFENFKFISLRGRNHTNNEKSWPVPVSHFFDAYCVYI